MLAPCTNSHILSFAQLQIFLFGTFGTSYILGFHEGQNGNEKMWEIINHFKKHSSDRFDMQSKDEFRSQQKAQKQQEEATAQKNRDNITIVDWGTVISKRSFRHERIAGDIKAHYGLQARLLFAQQLLHELLASDISSRAVPRDR